MTRDQFVANLKTATLDTAAESEMRSILNPPGRKPDRRNDDIAAWFRSLTAEQQQLAIRFAQLTGDSVLFGVLCVLDGVRSIRRSESVGELQVAWHEDGEATILNGDDGEMLHDIFGSLIRK